MKKQGMGKVNYSLLAFLATLCFAATLWAAPLEKIGKEERCAVCGMFVARYPTWATQLRLADGTVRYFDGCKDMMAYYFAPAKYGGKKDEVYAEIWVKDYYGLKWVNGREVFYVVGSDVNGPMGTELIPFASREAAENFKKDHHGRHLLGFAEISAALIDSLRAGTRMK